MGRFIFHIFISFRSPETPVITKKQINSSYFRYGDLFIVDIEVVLFSL